MSEQTKKQSKPKGKQTVKPSKVVKESKEAYFLRIATPRVKNILKGIRILGNCSNRNNYAYNQDQVNKMFATITEGLETTIMKFTPSKKEVESFEF